MSTDLSAKLELPIEGDSDAAMVGAIEKKPLVSRLNVVSAAQQKPVAVATSTPLGVGGSSGSRGETKVPAAPDGSSLLHIVECPHEYIHLGTCEDCGLAMSSSGSHLSHETEYTSSHQRAAPRSTLGFDKDLADKNFPAEIKAWVLQKAGSAPKQIHRMGKRDQILFAYVYLAYLQLQYPIKPEEIMSELGIKKTEISAAVQLASGIASMTLPQSEQDMITAPMNVVSPIRYIPEVVAVLSNIPNLKEHQPHITAIAEAALKKDQSLYEERPKHMAVGFLKYYLDRLGYHVPKFYSHFNMTSASINSYVRKIQKIMDQ
ncbi:Hypothetical protein POVN_LOCUS457 [uncultured virus]|nr:Hypothetical protein POVN_LOCUS457 [uncultured virus]